jgi:hypothetical protein
MEQLGFYSRIIFRDEHEEAFAYVYEHKFLAELCAVEGSNELFIGVGTKVLINDVKYEITDVSTVLKDHITRMSNPPGLNLYGIGGLQDFNFEVSYFVKRV